MPVELRVQAPLLPLSFLTACFGWNERDAVSAIEDGRIAYAFDIRSRASGRRCIRVHAGSVARFQGRGVDWPTVQDVVKDVFPFCYDPGTGIVARQITADPDLVRKLVADGTLIQKNGRICRQSLHEWLYRRRVF